MFLLPIALALGAHPNQDLLTLITEHPEAPKGRRCDGAVYLDSGVIYRSECEAVITQMPVGACFEGPRGLRDRCVGAWDALREGKEVGYHALFGPLTNIVDHPGLWRGDIGLVRISDGPRAASFGPWLTGADYAAEVAVYGPIIDPETYVAAYNQVKEMPGFREAFLADLKRRISFRPSRDPYRDFWHHGVLSVMYYLWQHDTGFSDDKPLLDARLSELTAMYAVYGRPDTLASHESGGVGSHAMFLKWARGYQSYGPRERLRFHGVGAWPPTLEEPRDSFAWRVWNGQQGWVRASLARDLRAVAREEFAAGRPAVAAVLEALIATVQPIRVTGADDASLTLCDDVEGEAVVRYGERYAFAGPVYDGSLPAAVFHIDDPVMRTQLTTRTTYQTVEREVSAARAPSADALARAAAIQSELADIEAAISRWSAWVGVRGEADASVTGFVCDPATNRCTSQWQGGGSSSVGAILDTKASRAVRDLEARRSALYAELGRLLPEGSYAPAVTRTDTVRRDITGTEASYDGTFVLSYRGIVQQFRTRSAWQDTARQARAEAVCEAASAAAEGLDAFFLAALGDAARAADTRTPTTDPVEQAVRAWPSVPRPEDIDALLKAVIGG